MKVHCPPFRKGSEWGMQAHPDFPCALWKRTTITFGEPVCGKVYECYADGNLWFTITPYSMTLEAGYACDGSSNSPDVPDDPFWGDNMLAAFFHDAGYQFSEVPLFREKFPRSFWDGLHYAVNREKKFKPRLLFRAVLFLFGWMNFGQRRNSKSRLEIIESLTEINKNKLTTP